MTRGLEQRIAHFRDSGILVDTNLLLVLLIGETRPELLTSFGRTSKYTPDDFHLLQEIVERIRVRWTSPAILTEVTNLVDKLKGKDRFRFLELLSFIMASSKEGHVPAADIAGTWQLCKYGYSDTTSLKLLPHDALLLTDDLDLYLHAKSAGLQAMNFTELQSFN